MSRYRHMESSVTFLLTSHTKMRWLKRFWLFSHFQHRWVFLMARNQVHCSLFKIVLPFLPVQFWPQLRSLSKRTILDAYKRRKNLCDILTVMVSYYISWIQKKGKSYRLFSLINKKGSTLFFVIPDVSCSSVFLYFFHMRNCAKIFNVTGVRLITFSPVYKIGPCVTSGNSDFLSLAGKSSSLLNGSA